MGKYLCKPPFINTVKRSIRTNALLRVTESLASFRTLFTLFSFNIITFYAHTHKRHGSNNESEQYHQNKRKRKNQRRKQSIWSVIRELHTYSRSVRAFAVIQNLPKMFSIFSFVYKFILCEMCASRKYTRTMLFDMCESHFLGNVQERAIEHETHSVLSSATWFPDFRFRCQFICLLQIFVFACAAIPNWLPPPLHPQSHALMCAGFYIFMLRLSELSWRFCFSHMVEN